MAEVGLGIGVGPFGRIRRRLRAPRASGEGRDPGLPLPSPYDGGVAAAAAIREERGP